MAGNGNLIILDIGVIHPFGLTTFLFMEFKATSFLERNIHIPPIRVDLYFCMVYVLDCPHFDLVPHVFLCVKHSDGFLLYHVF